MDLITWLVVGLVAGALASTLVRGAGHGLLGDIVLGIAGAVVGGWTFHELGWSTPFRGGAGTIFVAFIGAVIVLLAVRVLRPAARPAA
ncbi:MAG: GlsB/YeaQ/YmgE family stress response membrane protein [Kofleriaceae bacterium]